MVAHRQWNSSDRKAAEVVLTAKRNIPSFNGHNIREDQVNPEIHNYCRTFDCVALLFNILGLTSAANYMRLVVNPRNACTLRVIVLGLCLSVSSYSGTTSYEAAYQ